MSSKQMMETEIKIFLNYTEKHAEEETLEFRRITDTILNRSPIKYKTFERKNIGKCEAQREMARITTCDPDYGKNDVWMFVDGDIVFNSSTLTAMLEIPKSIPNAYVVPSFGKGNTHEVARYAKETYTRVGKYGLELIVKGGRGLAGGATCCRSTLFLASGGPDNISIYGGDEPTILPKLEKVGAEFILLMEQTVHHLPEKDEEYVRWKANCHSQMKSTGKGENLGFYELKEDGALGMKTLLATLPPKMKRINIDSNFSGNFKLKKAIYFIDGKLFNCSENILYALLDSILDKGGVAVVSNTIPKNEVCQLFKCQVNNPDWCGEAWKYVVQYSLKTKCKIVTHRLDNGYSVLTRETATGRETLVNKPYNWQDFLFFGNALLNIK